MLSPLFLISLLIPKLSSNAASQFVIDEMSGAFNGMGAFKRLNGSVLTAAKNLFHYVANAPILVMPILAIVATLYSIVLICIGLVFAILIPLDWLSNLVESIRRGIVRFINVQQVKIRHHVTAFLLFPLSLQF